MGSGKQVSSYDGKVTITKIQCDDDGAGMYSVTVCVEVNVDSGETPIEVCLEVDGFQHDCITISSNGSYCFSAYAPIDCDTSYTYKAILKYEAGMQQLEAKHEKAKTCPCS